MKLCENLKWNQMYSLGYSPIDDEHKHLFTLAQNIEVCQGDQKEVKKAIEALCLYTKFHFSNEEKHMQAIKYPHLDKHKLIHKKIVKVFDRFLEKIDTLSEQQVFQVLKKFINEYIIQHILLEDKKIYHFQCSKKDLDKVFNWKSVYNINQEMIDSEHQYLFEIANKALHAQDKQDPKKYVRQRVIELYDYMKLHFEHEQEFMKEIGFPEYEYHKKLHENIINEINKFVKEVPSLSITSFEKKLIEYMDIWLICHIVYEDKKISCFLSRKEQSIKKN